MKEDKEREEGSGVERSEELGEVVDVGDGDEEEEGDNEDDEDMIDGGVREKRERRRTPMTRLSSKYSSTRSASRGYGVRDVSVETLSLGIVGGTGGCLLSDKLRD